MRKWITAFGLFIMVVLPVMACTSDDETPPTDTPSPEDVAPTDAPTASPTTAPAAPEPTGTLTVAMETLGPHQDFLPWVMGAQQVSYALTLIGEFLVYADHETLEPIPGVRRS